MEQRIGSIRVLRLVSRLIKHLVHLVYYLVYSVLILFIADRVRVFILLLINNFACSSLFTSSSLVNIDRFLKISCGLIC